MLSSVLLVASAFALGVSADYPATKAVGGPENIRVPVIYVDAEIDVKADVKAHVDINLLNIVDVDVNIDIEADIDAKVQVWVGPEISFLHGRQWYLSNTSGTPFSNLTHAACEFSYQNPSDPKSEVDFLLNLEVGLVGLDVQVAAVFGSLTPYSNYPYSWKLAGTGALLGVTADISILAWGTDANGNAFLVIHNSAYVGISIGASISVYSASAQGVADVTLRAIIAASIDLHILDINVFINALISLNIDINANIQLLGNCDASCRANKNVRNFPLLTIGSSKFKA
ncbi:hypothetical protein CFE70_000367 [Pyrenophora teres f. teres 0-1]|uniref:Uncharacterized protein n=2 Tax=Pyrenophora teres f. teres TaxID=97479 RepID=E3S3H0_PYRTT|nr:hypothetical protein PTT_17015 [Pyrenophora teres f. teres 0-1]KAE8836372.1 hypothetical protein HRS9139_04470 [Pyrenophora teres f. teres]KAE8837657.1 hypothetical protein PTNB85_04992 [Pyrenophora teres f. teres]KAE8839923.1 hypothetical protein HRS9122_06528 [Pyrenophora teres f. teres]KAE8869281.1 hypothetical protein PTNB73_04334 [Pyrenophora teres f. teres]